MKHQFSALPSAANNDPICPLPLQHTVDQLLTIVGTQDCAETDALVSQEDPLVLE
jgi:hypothetical protein